MDYTTKDILNKFNHYDLAYTEKRCLFIFFSKRKKDKKAPVFIFRGSKNLEDIVLDTRGEVSQYVPMKKELYLKLPYSITHNLLTRTRCIIFIPQEKNCDFKINGYCFIDIKVRVD